MPNRLRTEIVWIEESFDLYNLSAQLDQNFMYVVRCVGCIHSVCVRGAVMNEVGTRRYCGYCTLATDASPL